MEGSQTAKPLLSRFLKIKKSNLTPYLLSQVLSPVLAFIMVVVFTRLSNKEDYGNLLKLEVFISLEKTFQY